VQPSSQQPEESARRAELLELLVAYARRHGLADVSLRPLAAAVGSSPRVLLYFFGSKENLVREVVAYTRAEQIATLTDAAALDRLWEWLAANPNVTRLFFESYGLSLRDDPGAYDGFAAASVREWLPHLTPLAGRLLPGADPEIGATLILAMLRGLLMDRLATGEGDRVDAAVALFERLLDA
jgi:AcrR family transcriptional regulator